MENREDVAQRAVEVEGLEVQTNHIDVTLIDVREDGRVRADPSKVQELAESLQEVGQLHPIIVRGKDAGRYELISGEHRLLAAQMQGQSRIWAVVRKADDDQAEMVSLVENLRRRKLSPAEQTDAVKRYAALQEKLFGKRTRGRPTQKGARRPISRRHAARALGLSETALKRDLVRGSKLAAGPQTALREGKISKAQADELVKLSPNEQEVLLPKAITMTRDETRRAVKEQRALACPAASLLLTANPTAEKTNCTVISGVLTDALRLTESVKELEGQFDQTKLEPAGLRELATIIDALLPLLSSTRERIANIEAEQAPRSFEKSANNISKTKPPLVVDVDGSETEEEAQARHNARYQR